MTSEHIKPENMSSDEESHKKLGRGVKDMVSDIMQKIPDLHQPGSSHPQDEDEHGVRIITLAGSNTGAAFQSEMDEKQDHHHKMSSGDPDSLSTYVNSNFQAINNSIMMGGSYNTNDPGVHLDISDFIEHKGHKPEKHGKKGKKKEKEMEKETVKGDHQSEHSS